MRKRKKELTWEQILTKDRKENRFARRIRLKPMSPIRVVSVIAKSEKAWLQYLRELQIP